MAGEEPANYDVNDINTALKEVIKNAMKSTHIIRGSYQTIKALNKGTAVLCILSENCDVEDLKKVVIALCAEKQIPLIKVQDNKSLGEWSGLCKIDQNGKSRKIVGCSTIALQDFGEESESLDILKEYIKAQSS